MADSNLNEIIGTSLSKIKELANNETVIGDPISVPGGVTIIPVSRVSLGFASGGIDFPDKKGEHTATKFGGGGGTGVTVTPIAFLIVSEGGNVELLPIINPSDADTLDKVGNLIEKAPSVLERIKNVFLSKKKKKEDCNCMQPPVIVSTRPRELDADVVKFQNNREKWIAFVGLLNGRPYEIFTGLADDDEGIMLPKNVSKGTIIKSYDEDGNKHYDFQFKNKRGYKMTIEGLDGKFNPEYWNYAKLISGVLRYGMPIDQVIKLVQGMELNSESINTWKNGVERALKKYLPNGMEAKGQKCPNCGLETLIYQEGCLICTNCGASKCG